jgi:DNA invertase Pin-like site-specific DNA recombinase
MSRVFAYCRVSTADQKPLRTRTREIAAAGFAVAPTRIVAETVSGSVPASEGPGFALLQHRLESGDVLVVTKLDRLGRNAMDVRATVEALATIEVRVHCLALGGVELPDATTARLASNHFLRTGKVRLWSACASCVNVRHGYEVRHGLSVHYRGASEPR